MATLFNQANENQRVNNETQQGQHSISIDNVKKQISNKPPFDYFPFGGSFGYDEEIELLVSRIE